ncbi:MAG: DUF294 nucleotidyltransferase-like domain-containing protein [Luteibaculaceae bacterium]
MTSSNPIALRLAQFLHSFEPFSFLAASEVFDLANQSKLMHSKANETIFCTGNPPLPYIFVVYKGEVELQNEENQQVYDTAEPGNIFGVRAMLTGKNYVLTAVTTKESLLIQLPIAKFKATVNQKPELSAWFASGLASGSILVGNQFKDVKHYQEKGNFGGDVLENQPIQYSKPITIAPHKTVKEVAQVMHQHKIGSLIVSENGNKALGIITDKDLRRALAEFERPALLLATELMSSPTLCISKSDTWHKAYLKMVKSKVRHLVITENGSPESALLGIISEHDLLKQKQNTAVSIAKQMSNATTVEELKILRNKADNILEQYFNENLPVETLCNLTALLNESLFTQLIKITLEAFKNKGIIILESDFCWLQLGSDARQEQVKRTDQDNCIVIANEVSQEKTAQILTFAQAVNKHMASCGFEPCPANIMAQNPDLCISLAQWINKFTVWIATPEPKALMNSTIFFDFKPLFGNLALAQKLTNAIVKQSAKNDIFKTLLAQNALQNPAALSFFNSLKVETDGENKNKFDIKARALMPIVDAARVLYLAHGELTVQSTIERLNWLAQQEPENASVYLDAQQAFEILLRIRTKNAFLNNDSGRFVSKNSLSHLEKSILKKTLQPIQQIQNLLENRFKTKMLS